MHACVYIGSFRQSCQRVAEHSLESKVRAAVACGLRHEGHLVFGTALELIDHEA